MCTGIWTALSYQDCVVVSKQWFQKQFGAKKVCKASKLPFGAQGSRLFGSDNKQQFGTLYLCRFNLILLDKKPQIEIAVINRQNSNPLKKTYFL